MKQLTLTISYTFLSILLLGQNKEFWIEAPSPYNSNIEIFGLLSNGGIVGKTSNPDKTLFSEDNGMTWQELNLEFPLSRNTEQSLDYYGGKIYHGNFLGFWEINPSDETYNKILGFDDGCDDFAIFPDGRKLILSSRGDLITLDNQNAEINRINLGTAIPFGQILYDGLGTIYITYMISGDRVMQSVSSDLISLGTAVVIPPLEQNPAIEGVTSYYSYRYWRGIIYSADAYSDDGGITWIKYNRPSQPILAYDAGFEGVLFFIGENQLFRSFDKGNSFTSIPLGFTIEDSKVYLFESPAGLFLSLESCGQSRAYLSNNNGLSWTEIDTNLGQAVSYEIAAGLNGNVFVSTCSEGTVFDQYRLTENGPWEESTVRNLGNLVALPSGTIIGTTLREYCRSTDHGKTWTCLPYNSTNIRSVLQYRGNKLYMYGYGDEVWVSDDDGLTFAKYNISLTNLSEVEFLPSGKMIAAKFGEDTIREINLFDQTESILDNYEGTVLNIATLSTDDVVYVLGFTDSNREQVTLTKYENGLEDLIPLNLPLKPKHIYQLEVDLQNQLFIYGALSDRVAGLEKENVAFFSNDRGASWIDISPFLPTDFSINDLYSGIDSYVYLAVEGRGPLRSCCPLSPFNSFVSCADQIDSDGDGYGLVSDCDDRNANVNPGLVEIPYNGVDDDCNPQTLDDDLDQDGFVMADDCDDNNAIINPDATEIPDNGIDENCDGIDATALVDADGDGYFSDEDCDDNNAGINPGIIEACNDIDDNCDGNIDENLPLKAYYLDMDGDGFGDPNSTIVDCFSPNGFVDNNTDCDDSNPEINPAATEIPNNGIDEDCDGMDSSTLVDTDGDGYFNDIDCDDNNAAVNPGATEICNDLDDNCDGTVDENQVQNIYFIDSDGDGFGDPDVTISDCNLPNGYVIDNADCNDSDPNINPFASDIPNNGIDEDCDGMDKTSSTDELSPATVKLYPNPFGEALQIKVTGELSFQVSLFNLQGQLVHRSANLNIVQLEHISDGTYIVEIQNLNTGERYLERVVRMR